MFYKKRLINTLNCKYKLFINRCERNFEKVFLALTPLKLQSNENLFLNLLDFNNIFLFIYCFEVINNFNQLLSVVLISGRIRPL